MMTGRAPLVVLGRTDDAYSASAGLHGDSKVGPFRKIPPVKEHADETRKATPGSESGKNGSSLAASRYLLPAFYPLRRTVGRFGRKFNDSALRKLR